MFNQITAKDIKALRKIVGRKNVLDRKNDLLLYSYDASLEKGLPGGVVFPPSAAAVAGVVSYCCSRRLPLVARGAGTNLSGGSVPLQGGVILQMFLLDRIEEIRAEDRVAVVEPGVTTQQLNDAAVAKGLLYAPDPASMKVSTIGGNLAENAGGPHCLKYGVTTNHVLGLEMVDGLGRLVKFGGDTAERGPGGNVVNLVVGSEGTLGVVTRAWLKLIPRPAAVRTMLALFDELSAAGEAVSGIISAGIVPASLEMMDRLVISAVQDAEDHGYPGDVEVVLIIELDGRDEEIALQADAVVKVCRRHGAREVRRAKGEMERERLWSGRRGAVGAVARIKPNHLVMDGVVPRTRLPEAMLKVVEIGRKYGLITGNLLHAGDGNLHPLLLLDERDVDEVERAKKAGQEIARACLEMGGTLSGEHGIGLEKKDLMPALFSAVELELFRDLKRVFDPKGILNPGKMF